LSLLSSLSQVISLSPLILKAFYCYRKCYVDPGTFSPRERFQKRGLYNPRSTRTPGGKVAADASVGVACRLSASGWADSLAPQICSAPRHRSAPKKPASNCSTGRQLCNAAKLAEPPATRLGVLPDRAALVEWRRISQAVNAQQQCARLLGGGSLRCAPAPSPFGTRHRPTTSSARRRA